MRHLKIYDNFIGVNANLGNKKSRKLSIAREMEKRGADSNKIFLLTGWFRNKFDTRWRYENPADSIQFKNIIEGTQIKALWTSVGSYPFYLKDVIHYTTLFKEYPELKNIVVFISKRGLDGNASYNPTTRQILLNGVKMDNRVSDISFDLLIAQEELDSLSPADEHKRQELSKQISMMQAEYDLVKTQFFTFKPEHKSSLMHEIQHAIQHIESFPSGSSSKMFQPETQIYNHKTKTYKTFTDMDMYRNTTGEIEAREVQSRLKRDTTIKRKQDMPFADTIDVEDSVEAHWNEDSENKHDREIKKGN